MNYRDFIEVKKKKKDITLKQTLSYLYNVQNQKQQLDIDREL